MKPKITKYFTIEFLIVFVSLIVVILIFKDSIWRRKFPENEWHSKHLCSRQKLSSLQSGLERHMGEHDNFLPNSLHELMEEGNISQSDMICPSQYKLFDQDFLRRGNFPFYIECFELIAAQKNFDNLSEGEIIIKEFSGNHPSGYHVIRKKGDFLTREFINLEK